MMTAADMIARFGLKRHPEGGWYRQTWIADAPNGMRSAGTAILFLLQAGESSHWHKVDATEIWHFHAGAPLALDMAAKDAGPATRTILGDVTQGHAPQAIVPPDYWQAACSMGDWSLVGCTVSPAFRFEGFTLAPKGFDIPRGA